MSLIVVGISDMKLAKPPDTLITYALGSCVGICLHDSLAKVAGLSHIMLPSRSIAPRDTNVAKFADTAIPELVARMERAGAMRSRMVAKIAGGAQMFEDKSSFSAPMWQIGQRNVVATLEALSHLGIRMVAKDVLKNYGRTVSFDPTTGAMTVTSLSRPASQL